MLTLTSIQNLPLLLVQNGSPGGEGVLGRVWEKIAPEITIFQAKKIITMNPSNPEGTHVAVRDGPILGVGSLEAVKLCGFEKYDVEISQRSDCH